MAIDTNRTTTIQLPPSVSSEILQKTQKTSVVMGMARQVPLPGTGAAIPVILDDPEAEYVGETDEKPVSKASTTIKMLQPYKLSVIELFSDEFRRDAASLYDALVLRLPNALSKKFDASVLTEGVKPDMSNFDALVARNTYSTDALIGSNPVVIQDMSGKFTADKGLASAKSLYDALVNAKSDIAGAGNAMSGLIFTPTGETELLRATDTTGRPLFTSSMAEGVVPRILSVPALTAAAGHSSPDLAFGVKTGDNAGFNFNSEIIAVAGDWTQAVYGVVDGINIGVTDQATINYSGQQINLWQRGMFAVKAEIEVGFRCMYDAFNMIVNVTDSSKVGA